MCVVVLCPKTGSCNPNYSVFECQGPDSEIYRKFIKFKIFNFAYGKINKLYFINLIHFCIIALFVAFVKLFNNNVLGLSI